MPALVCIPTHGAQGFICFHYLSLLPWPPYPSSLRLESLLLLLSHCSVHYEAGCFSDHSISSSSPMRSVRIIMSCYNAKYGSPPHTHFKALSVTIFVELSKTLLSSQWEPKFVWVWCFFFFLLYILKGFLFTSWILLFLTTIHPKSSPIVSFLPLYHLHNIILLNPSFLAPAPK